MEAWGLGMFMIAAGSVWTLLAADEVLNGRHFHSAAFDPAVGGLLIYGGQLEGPGMDDFTLGTLWLWAAIETRGAGKARGALARRYRRPQLGTKVSG